MVEIPLFLSIYMTLQIVESYFFDSRVSNFKSGEMNLGVGRILVYFIIKYL